MKKCRIDWKTKFNMAINTLCINNYLESMNLKLQSKDMQWQMRRKNFKRAYTMLPIRDEPQDKGHTQAESEGMEKYFMPAKMTGK